MNILDNLMEFLRDSQWHSIGSTKEKVALPDEKFNKILSFLKDTEFIDKENETIRLTSLGLRFLELSS